MFIPESVSMCIRALEEAGYRAYCVGGCVRDSLLGITPHDYDLCTNARPTQTAEVFRTFSLVRSGEKHGTIGVVVDREVIEITTFRTEGDYHDSRHPDWVDFVDKVEADLARRDFTINAMAYAPNEGYIDPWGGREDLKNGILRAVGDPQVRFREDALRILRGARFVSRFHLTPEPATLRAMETLAPLLENLARERVFDELCKLLTTATARDLMTFAPVLVCAIPQISPCVGFRQHSPHHKFDVFVHTAHVVEAVKPDLALRWAALLHDVGKPASFTMDEFGRGHFLGHALLGSAMAEEILRELKAPTALRERVVFLIAHHMTPFEPDKRLLRRRLGRFGEEAVRQLLCLQKADFCSKGTVNPRGGKIFDTIAAMLEEILEEDACLQIRDLKINGRDLIALGFPIGPAIGDCLEHLLAQIQDEQLPNTKEALLQEAERYIKEINL